MITIISKGQTDDLILVTLAIQKEPLKVPMMVDVVDANDILDETIRQIIKQKL